MPNCLRCQLVLFFIMVPDCPLYIAVPNSPLFIAEPNCPTELSYRLYCFVLQFLPLWCGIIQIFTKCWKLHSGLSSPKQTMTGRQLMGVKRHCSVWKLPILPPMMLRIRIGGEQKVELYEWWKHLLRMKGDVMGIRFCVFLSPRISIWTGLRHPGFHTQSLWSSEWVFLTSVSFQANSELKLRLSVIFILT